MRKFVIFAVMLFLLLPVSYSHGATAKEKAKQAKEQAPFSHGFKAEGQDCSKCHTLSKDEALILFKDLIPNAKILNVSASPVAGLWEVDVDAGGRKMPMYVDFSKKHLFSGALIAIGEKRNISQERADELNKLSKDDVSNIPLDDTLVVGSKDAKHKVIVFSDPDWPYCVKLHQEMKRVTEERKDIAFHVKMYPLPMHKGAYDKAKAIVCEKSLTMLEDAYDKKELPKPKCETTVIDENIKLAEKLGIRGTPALIFPDGKVIPGAIDAKTIIGQIDNSAK